MVQRLTDPETLVDGQPAPSVNADADETPTQDFRRLVEGPDQPAAGQWDSVSGRTWR